MLDKIVKRRNFLLIISLGLFLSSVFIIYAGVSQRKQPLSEGKMQNYDVSPIHRKLTVCDAHCDTVERIINQGIDLSVKSDQGHIDIPRLMEGGVDVQVFACCVRSGKPAGEHVKLAIKMINALHFQFREHNDVVIPALKASDILKTEQDGKIAAIIAIEGGQAIEDNLNLLQCFYNMGARILTITWKSTNWADASQEPPRHNGLTSFGRDVVREMNRLGMIIDVSHASDKTVWDVLETSSAPIIASHSCAKAICSHPRNLNDDLIKAIAKAGGVICVNFYSLFLDQEFKNQLEAKKNPAPEPPPMSKIIEHIDHIVRLGGIDSAGLGSDFDGMNPPPKGLEDVSKMPRITEALLERGYSVEEVKKIMGGNFLRVFSQVCGY